VEEGEVEEMRVKKGENDGLCGVCEGCICG